MAKKIEVVINQDNINVTLDRVNLDGYLPLAGGDMTGNLILPQDTASLIVGDTSLRSYNDAMWGQYYGNLTIQASEGNKDTVLKIAPNGTAENSVIELTNAYHTPEIYEGLQMKMWADKFWFQMRATPGRSRRPIIMSADTSLNQFVLNTDGKVGIGTNAPAEALQVNGKISIRNTTTQSIIETVRNSTSTDGIISHYTANSIFSVSNPVWMVGLVGGSNNYRITTWDGASILTKLTLTTNGDLISSKTMTATQYKLSTLNTAPASQTDTGTLGEIRVTSTYIYVCTATNNWVRAALTTW